MRRAVFLGITMPPCCESFRSSFMSITTLNGMLVVVIECHLGTSLTENKSFESLLSLNELPGLAGVSGSPTTIGDPFSGHVRSKSEMEIVPYIKEIICHTYSLCYVTVPCKKCLCLLNV